VIRNGKVLGMAALSNKEGGYDSNLVEFLQPFCTTFAAMIESYRVHEGTLCLLLSFTLNKIVYVARNHAEKEFQLAKKKAEELSMLKSRILTNTSHGTNNPLVVSLFIPIFRAQDSIEFHYGLHRNTFGQPRTYSRCQVWRALLAPAYTCRPLLSQIHLASRSLLGNINSFLDYSRLASSRGQVRHLLFAVPGCSFSCRMLHTAKSFVFLLILAQKVQALDLWKLLEEAVEVLAPAVTEKNLGLYVTIDPAVPRYIVTDKVSSLLEFAQQCQI
jgi:signal transduction histidine kinase